MDVDYTKYMRIQVNESKNMEHQRWAGLTWDSFSGAEICKAKFRFKKGKVKILIYFLITLF